jgi:hypothetical protein
MKLYIAVLDEFPDYMVPTLVAHSVLGAHLKFTKNGPFAYYTFGKAYEEWLLNSFKKCVVRVNQCEFDKIAALEHIYLGHERSTLDGRVSCAVVCPRQDVPNVLKFAKLWAPKAWKEV